MVVLFVIKWKENMVMMIRIFFFYLFESIKSLKWNGWMIVVLVSVVIIILVLVGIFMGVIFNVMKFVDDIEKNVIVFVFVDIGIK